MGMITVLYKIDKETMQLVGCEGIHETSNWKCENCSGSLRNNCRLLLNKHPDILGRLVA